jgi:hypothetical protein
MTNFSDEQSDHYAFKPELVYEPAFELNVSKYAIFNMPFIRDFCPVKTKFANEILGGLLMSPK